MPRDCTLADLGARFIAALTMMRVDKISCSRRGRMPGRASGGAYATPFGAMMSLAPDRATLRYLRGITSCLISPTGLALSLTSESCPQHSIASKKSMAVQQKTAAATTLGKVCSQTKHTLHI